MQPIPEEMRKLVEGDRLIGNRETNDPCIRNSDPVSDFLRGSALVNARVDAADDDEHRT